METSRNLSPQPRQIATRLVVEGVLELLTPAHFGNGDAAALTDMPLLIDAYSGQPLLQGTSIAGALRGYLLTVERGFRSSERRRSNPFTAPGGAAERLFGGVKGDEYGEQSPLMVADALGELPAIARVEVRDGVRIDTATQTAADRFKYDLELLPAGTRFAVRFELLLPPGDMVQLRSAFDIALRGLMAQDGLPYAPITLGARRSRGFGRCVVSSWQLREYRLRDNVDALLAWLAADHPDWVVAPATYDHVPVQDLPSARRLFRIQASFALESPLLIRSTEPISTSGDQPDHAHLRSWRGDSYAPIIAGTSLAGVLRARAQRILFSLSNDPAAATVRVGDLLDALFGRDMTRRNVADFQDAPDEEEQGPTASRLIVEEHPLQDGQLLVQNRVAIDRFTGGAFATALFAEAPHVGGTTELVFTLLRDAPERKDALPPQEADAQIGVLLLLLKDLWTGDLAIGGTASIGRGRLRGLAATFSLQEPGSEQRWQIVAQEQGLSIVEGDAARLQHYVEAVQAVIAAGE